MEESVDIKIVVRIQALIRRYRDRKKLIKLLENKYEKIYDPNRRKYFYYDIVNDVSSWNKPAILHESDLEKVSSLYSEEEAAGMIQRQFRRMLALWRVRMLYQKRVKAIKDKAAGTKYYYNKVTQQTFWDLPEFMADKLKYAYDIDLREPKKSDSDSDQSSEEEEEEDDESSDDDESDTSSVAREKRRLERKYPRSKCQELIDECEDRVDKKATLVLNLSGFNATRFSSRVFDCTHLKRLILSNNRLTHLSTDIKFLINLEVLDVRKNKLRTLPIEVEELKCLHTMLLGHNKFENLPGNIYKLAGMKTLDLSYNRFPIIPIEVGNMELLKVLHEWEVGISLYQQLTELNVSKCKLSEWPDHIDKIATLQMLNLSGNGLESVSASIGCNTNLKYLDLSENRFIVLPVDFYSCTQLQTLILRNNSLIKWPSQSKGNVRMPAVTSIDISHNAFEIIDTTFLIFPRLQILNISYNKVKEIDKCICQLTMLHTLDVRHNKLEMVPDKLGACITLHTLHLSYNLMSDFPSCIPHLMHLKYLDLSHNAMVDPKPTYFATLLKLQDLDLSHNEVAVIPGSLFSLSKLQTLDFSHNKIEFMPEMFCKMTSLQTLDMSYNRVNGIPPEISVLTGLRSIELRNNCIVSIPDSLTAMKSLSHIDLMNNNLSSFPEPFRRMQQLIGWNVSGNPIPNYLDSLREEDDDMSLSVEDWKGGDTVMIKKLGKRVNKMWIKLEDTTFEIHFKGAPPAVIRDKSLESDIGQLDAVTVPCSWLEKLRAWSKDLAESVYVVTNLSTSDRGASCAAALRTILIDPEHKKVLSDLSAPQFDDYNPYPSHIFSTEVLQVLSLGSSLVECIHGFERICESIYAVSETMKSAEEEKLSAIRENKYKLMAERKASLPPPATADRTRPRIIGLTEEEVEAEMDSRIQSMVSASLTRRSSMRESFRASMQASNDLEDPGSSSSSEGARLWTEEDGIDKEEKKNNQLKNTNQIEDRESRSFDQDDNIPSGDKGDVESKRDSEVSDDAIDDGKGVNSASISVRSEYENHIEGTREQSVSKVSDDGLHTGEMQDDTLRDLAVGSSDISHSTNGEEVACNTASIDDEKVNITKPSKNKNNYKWKMTDILFDPCLGDPLDSFLYRIALECYYGMGLALVERGECLTQDIRRVESNTALISVLGVANRKGNDMKDLLVGYEKHFPRPRRGSTTSNSTLKVPSLFSVGDASSHDKVGAQDTTNKLEGSEADDLSITSTSLAGTSIALEVSAEDQVLQALHHQHARAIVRELLVERRNIYVWSMIVLACASDLLKLCGWDAVSESAVENKDITVLFSAKDLSAVAVGVGLSYARALTGFGMYSMAVLEFEKVLRLSPKHRTAELGRIRCLCALGDFPKAKTSLTTIIVEAFNKDIRDISLVSLMKRDTELGYLMLYIDACMNSLVSTGYGAKPDCRTYKLMDDGILDRHPLSYNLFEHGECPYNKWYVEKRKNAVMANVVRVRESEDRSKYKQKSAQTMRSAKDVIDAHKAMMMQLGPVTIT